VHHGRLVRLVHGWVVELIVLGGAHVLAKRVFWANQVLWSRKIRQERTRLILQIEILLHGRMQIVLHPLKVLNAVVVSCSHIWMLFIVFLGLFVPDKSLAISPQIIWQFFLALVSLENALHLVICARKAFLASCSIKLFVCLFVSPDLEGFVEADDQVSSFVVD